MSTETVFAREKYNPLFAIVVFLSIYGTYSQNIIFIYLAVFLGLVGYKFHKPAEKNQWGDVIG